MEFFNKKEEVIDLQLTQYGRYLLSRGRFKPVYYAFYDDNVLYNPDWAGIEETQNESEDRIKTTPVMHPQTGFSSLEKEFQNNYNLGFLRVEVNKKNKKLYSTDQVEKSQYYIHLSKTKYLVLANSNSSFWIYDKDEFSEFIKTKYWRFDWKWISISDILLIREMAAVGWHGQNMNGIDMGRYLATIVPLKNGKVENKSFIRHLSDNYANAPRGLFGTFSMNDIVKKDLKKFIPTSFLGRFFKRLKYMAYHLLRINIKKHFRTNKLHNDLKSGLIFR